ncbi:uncharacterized protein MONBRDRAFT_7586 [Monosiga brevicollis MX1]|uniref:Uncharacterized protein n=1 Tax=Monosiga brevicollis TaxID=81824 RepID=A9UXQ0_MONBE|nr:uncharacterized protein MONBRDRAFT_7586 [Monosiga brevicollis MX1]EDQ89727.1 predicted protein [Monosiga brevicollis MX1]|eukprot:XP_001745149.1 hypothetical protein [Monosiga brevicollis MX1]
MATTQVAIRNRAGDTRNVVFLPDLPKEKHAEVHQLMTTCFSQAEPMSKASEQSLTTMGAFSRDTLAKAASSAAQHYSAVALDPATGRTVGFCVQSTLDPNVEDPAELPPGWDGMAPIMDFLTRLDNVLRAMLLQPADCGQVAERLAAGQAAPQGFGETTVFSASPAVDAACRAAATALRQNTLGHTFMIGSFEAGLTRPLVLAALRAMRDAGIHASCAETTSPASTRLLMRCGFVEVLRIPYVAARDARLAALRWPQPDLLLPPDIADPHQAFCRGMLIDLTTANLD